LSARVGLGIIFKRFARLLLVRGVIIEGEELGKSLLVAGGRVCYEVIQKTLLHLLFEFGVHARLADENTVVSVDSNASIKLNAVFIVRIESRILGGDDSGMTNRGLI